MNSSTDGWFWTYISKIHRAHDFNWDRFYASFGNILWHFPLMTLVIVAGAIVLAATYWKTRMLPPGAQSFLLWLGTFALSIVVGSNTAAARLSNQLRDECRLQARAVPEWVEARCFIRAHKFHGQPRCLLFLFARLRLRAPRGKHCGSQQSNRDQ